MSEQPIVTCHICGKKSHPDPDNQVFITVNTEMFVFCRKCYEELPNEFTLGECTFVKDNHPMMLKIKALALPRCSVCKRELKDGEIFKQIKKGDSAHTYCADCFPEEDKPYAGPYD